MSDESTLSTLDGAELETVLGGITSCYPGKPAHLPSLGPSGGGGGGGGGAGAGAGGHAASALQSATNPTAGLHAHASKAQDPGAASA